MSDLLRALNARPRSAVAPSPEFPAIDVAAFWAAVDALDRGRGQRAPGDVLRLRFDRNGTLIRTYAQVGQALGVGEQRARELTIHALRRARHIAAAFVVAAGK